MKLTKSSIIFLAAISLILVLGSFYTWSIVSKNNGNKSFGSQAEASLSISQEESPYTDINGNPVVLTEYLGGILVVNSWASWSPYSVKELSDLSRLAKTYEEQNVRVIAINRAESSNTAERFLKTVGASDNVLLVLDPDDKFYKSISGFSMPETVFYDSDGNIAHHEHGVLNLEKATEIVEKILENERTQ